MRIALPAAIDPRAFIGLDPAAPVIALGGITMGTTWRVLLVAPPGLSVAALDEAIVRRLDVLVAEMSHWEAASVLCRFNRARAGGWMSLPPDFAQVMAVSLDLAARTGGAFDPALGQLVDLWGFGPPGPRAVPDGAAIEAARAVSGWERLGWDSAARRLCQPGGLALDLSGVAKGHAADAVADLLGGHGIRHCLVEVGGELVGRGVQPSGEPWWVDLECPPGLALPPLRLALHGIAVATSGTYRRGDHMLDPRTGRPATHNVVGASVVASTAAVADGWASALTVLGPVDGIALAERHGIAARLVTVTAGKAVEWVSAAMTDMVST